MSTKLFDTLPTIEDIDKQLSLSLEEYHKHAITLDNAFSILDHVQHSVKRKKSILDTIEHYSLEEIQNEIANRPDTSLLNIEITTYSLESNGSYHGLYFSLEEDKSIIGKIIEFIKNLLKKMKDIIVKVARWIGEKLGLIKKKTATVKKDYKTTEETVKQNIKGRPKEKPLKVAKLTKELEDRILRDFRTLIYIHGEFSYEALNSIQFEGIDRNIRKVIDNLNKLSDSHLDVIESIHGVEVKYSNIATFNKGVKEPFKTKLRGNRYASFGNIHKNNVSIINEYTEGSGGNAKTIITYEKTTVTKELKPDTIKEINNENLQMIQFLAEGVKLLDTIENASDSTTPTNEILKIPDIIDKLINKEKDEWMLNYLKNISTALVPYMLDSLASVTILANDTLTIMDLLLEHNKKQLKEDKKEETK